ncbi:MAG: MFS transporter [Chloroflexota bacterium]|nr:MFS transporter [Chloroflexota bacterium]
MRPIDFATVTRALSRDVFARFKPGIWVITALAFLNAVGFAISLPFLSLYLYQERGLSMTAVGAIILVSGLSSGVVQVFGGSLSDRFGRRPLLLSSVAVAALLYAGIAVLIALSAPIWALVLVYTAGRSILVVGRPVSSAMVVDLSPKERLAETYGLLRVGQNLGWAAGPAMGGHLLAYLSYAWLFGLAALVGVLSFLLVFLFLRESCSGCTESTKVRSMFAVGKDRAFLGFTLLSLLIFIVQGQMISTLSVFSVDRVGFTTAEYGLLLTMNGLVVVLFQYPTARAINHFAKYRTLALGSLFYAFGYFFIGRTESFILALVAMVVITIGEIIYSPITLAVVGELSSESWRGRYMGFYSLSETLGLSIGPLLGGVLLDGFPDSSLFIWGTIALLALLAAFGFYGWGAARRTGQFGRL